MLANTGQQQEPYVYGPPLGRAKHYFLPPAGTPSPALPTAPAPDPELLAFQAAQRSGSEAAWRSFLQSYPHSAYAATANIELAVLTRPASPAPKPSAPAVTAVGTTFRDCANCPEMVRIPGGSFRMGDLREKGNSFDKPVRMVTVRAFSVGKYEVTFDEWDACVTVGGCKTKPSDEGWGRGRRPAVNVRWLSGRTGKQYRLLSEAEWEYVARAGTMTEYSWGNDIGRNRANCDGCGSRWDGKQTVPVGSFSANPWGLYDVHGNVSEWTQDCENYSYTGAPMDGSARESGDCSWRMVRGGGWYDVPRYLHSAFRVRIAAAAAAAPLGFRLARTE